LLSCGGDSSGVDRSKSLGSLAGGEKLQVCDEVNGAQGGYGRVVTCSDAHTEHTDSDQASCVAASPTSGQPCGDLTVGALLDCAHGVGTNLCAFATAPACQPVRDCIGP
jgi:hypothetical protein